MMKGLTILFFVFMAFGCADEAIVNSEFHAVTMLEPIQEDELYALKFEIDKDAESNYLLKVTIDLFKDSYVVSPVSKELYLGRFLISVTDSTQLSVDHEFKESPKSVLSEDPFGNGPVYNVYEKTSYTKKIEILDNNDFEVEGRITFTIEPRCTFEEIRFQITQNDGELSVKQLPKNRILTRP